MSLCHASAMARTWTLVMLLLVGCSTSTGDLDSDGDAVPGRISETGLSIECSDGSLKLIQVQRAGKKPMSSEEFLRGFPDNR